MTQVAQYSMTHIYNLKYDTRYDTSTVAMLAACFCIRDVAMDSVNNHFSESVMCNYSQSVISILHDIYPVSFLT